MVGPWTLKSRRPFPTGLSPELLALSGCTIHNSPNTGNGPGNGAATITWSRCALMGIVNVTPDSFSDGGEHFAAQHAIEHGLRLADHGALVVDVGGESTRPGAVGVAADTEIARVIPVVSALAMAGRSLISIDTRKPEVAAAAVAAGAHIVNDIGGMRDPDMVATCVDLGVPVVVMHMQGTPETMQVEPHYADVVAEVGEWLAARATAVVAAGVPSALVDPGIGFGKTFEHNIALLRALPLSGTHPVLVGVSRKRMIQQILGVESMSRRDPGSAAVHLWAAQCGAAMVRVHDVAMHREVFAADNALRES